MCKVKILNSKDEHKQEIGDSTSIAQRNYPRVNDRQNIMQKTERNEFGIKISVTHILTYMWFVIQGENKEIGAEEIIKEIVETFKHWVKKLYTDTESSANPSRINTKKTTNMHLLFKLLKTEDER